jgi:hypothetical protein
MQCGARAFIAWEMSGGIYATTPGPAGEFRFEHNSQHPYVRTSRRRERLTAGAQRTGNIRRPLGTYQIRVCGTAAGSAITR